MSQITLSQFMKSASTLPGTIQGHRSNDEFLCQFKELFRCQDAKDASNVLYAFLCEKKIPRVKSKSNVLYVGCTKETLSSRYLSAAKTMSSGENWDFYSYIIEHYGPIRIMYRSIVDIGTSLKEGEAELLKDYFKLHREYPPKNFQSR